MAKYVLLVSLLVATVATLALARNVADPTLRGSAVEMKGLEGDNGRKLQVPGGLNYVPHYDICYNPWGVFQCCADDNNYCFKHNPWYSQCLTPEECMQIIKDADQCAKRFPCGTGDGTGR